MHEDLSNAWTRLSSRLVYSNKWLRIREDQVIRPDGLPGIYAVVEIPYSVGIVALDDQHRVALTQQWRYTHNKISLEIPVGGSGEGDLIPQDCAMRELREETGIRANTWRFLGRIENSNGVTTDVAHHFLATDLTVGGNEQDAEERIHVRWTELSEIPSLIRAGKIVESSSVVCLMKVFDTLKNNFVWWET